MENRKTVATVSAGATVTLSYEIGEDGGILYSITAEDGDLRRTFSRFTSNPETAWAYFRLLAENEVSPYHLRDIYLDRFGRES